jgi:hypothetical protein
MMLWQVLRERTSVAVFSKGVSLRQMKNVHGRNDEE